MTARDRMVVVIVLVLAAVGGSWLMVVAPKRDQASKLGDQVAAEQTQLDTARTQVAAGEAARGAYAASYTMVARLGEAVPADDNIPSLIYQLQGAAAATGVDFRVLALNSGSAAAGPPAAAGGSASAAQAASATLPPGAAVGAAEFPTEPFNFTFRGNFFHLADFFGRLQRFVVATNRRVSISGRLMTLNAISLGPGPRGFPQITATIAATTYLVPAGQGVLAGASPSAPAAGSPAQTLPASTTTPTVPPAAVVSSPAK